MGNPKGFLEVDREKIKLRDPKERIKDYRQHEIPAGDARVRSQASRCMECGVPFCMSGCPLGNYIPDWNDHVYQGKWEEALRALHATNNFPEFTGLVCPAPCENACVLGITHPAVGIKQVESTIISRGFEQGLIEAVAPQHRSGRSVAIIGSGPAGLACAQQLNRAGHEVTVFERRSSPGGLFLYGIPSYKLPLDIFARRIDLLQKEGIKFKTNCDVGSDASFQQLSQDFDATVLCVGAEKPRDLPIPGRDLRGVHFAMDFLAQQARCELHQSELQNQVKIVAKDKRVIVIGGGDTGSDCMGTSLRQGAKVVTNFELLEKPPAERAPSSPWPQDARVFKVSSSMEETLAVGGAIAYQVLTKRFIGDELGQVIALETVDVAWRPDPATGTPCMQEVDGSVRRWDADLVLLAMGYLAPLTEKLSNEFDVALDARGNIATDEDTKMTNIEGLFAAGDCRWGQSLIVWAIAEGHDTAACVDRWLKQSPSALPRVRTTRYSY